MEIRQLRSFLVLAEELHFGRAAARLHVAQSALSQQLKLLERQLGLRLLDRTNRHVALTDAGARLVLEAGAAVERFDEAMANMARVRTGEVGRLVLGVSPGVDSRILQRLLSTATNVNSEIQPRQVTSTQAVTGLGRHELDAALVHATPDQPEIAHLVLVDEELGVALPSSHRLARARAVRPAELNGEPVIWLARRTEPDVYDAVFASLTAAGYLPGPARETPNVETSLSLVAAGGGVSLKLKHEVRRGQVGVVWRPFKALAISVPTTLVWRRGDRAPLLWRLIRAGQEIADEP
ncbi:MAG: LysR family transcriptional regulator [Propionibacteriaceae bacterium]|nr:LysR family transcriptional regulator [Propionibacteriaceae bacterium]